MGRIFLFAAASMMALTLQAAAKERVVCTVAWEIGAQVAVLNDGQCDARISPASTFKIAISLMGFDSGILTSSDTPEWPFKEGYIDWRAEWKQSTRPESWLRYSVIWYSQQITQTLGHDRFASYVQKFGYGNEDISGNKGKHNGLTHAWLSSSLQISPTEQVGFLMRMLEGQLPVSTFAVSSTTAIMEHHSQPDGWDSYGKTGAGLPFGEDGELVKGQPFGWYVGWLEKGGRKVVFARLVQFDERPGRVPGLIARDGLMEELFSPEGPLF